jgi:hypothetical protein
MSHLAPAGGNLSLAVRKVAALGFEKAETRVPTLAAALWQSIHAGDTGIKPAISSHAS